MSQDNIDPRIVANAQRWLNGFDLPEVIAYIGDPLQAFLSNCEQDGIDPLTMQPLPPEPAVEADIEDDEPAMFGFNWMGAIGRAYRRKWSL